MLDADTQRFLAHHYSHTDDLLDGDESSVKASGSGSFGRDIVCFATCSDGIGWSHPGEPHIGFQRSTDWPHWVRWAPIRAHMDAQPQHLRDQLHAANRAHCAEHSHHWEAERAIHDGRTMHISDEQRTQLDAERARHYAALRPLRAAVKAAVLALLPLATDEPADLIEWAAAMEPTGRKLP